MYGVPGDLDLTRFHGAVLERIDLGKFIVHFRFTGPSIEIAVEGDWELADPNGRIVDRQQEVAERDCYRLHVLLGQPVLASELAAPESFTLRFESGHQLRIFDRSAQYESFAIQPGNIYV